MVVEKDAALANLRLRPAGEGRSFYSFEHAKAASTHWVFDPQTAVTIYLWAPCGSRDANECCKPEFYTYTKHMQRARRVGHAQSVTRHTNSTVSASCHMPPFDRAHARASHSDL